MGRKFAADWRSAATRASPGSAREFRRNRATCLSCWDLYKYPGATRGGSGVSSVEALIDLVIDFTRHADQDPRTPLASRCPPRRMGLFRKRRIGSWCDTPTPTSARRPPNQGATGGKRVTGCIRRGAPRIQVQL